MVWLGICLGFRGLRSRRLLETDVCEGTVVLQLVSEIDAAKRSAWGRSRPPFWPHWFRPNSSTISIREWTQRIFMGINKKVPHYNPAGPINTGPAGSASRRSGEPVISLKIELNIPIFAPRFFGCTTGNPRPVPTVPLARVARRPEIGRSKAL